MHAAVTDWVREHAPDGYRRVLDVGGRDINGNPQGLFDASTDWTVVDVVDGPRVTHVCDVRDFWDDPYDVVLCLEVAEHTSAWREIITHCAELTGNMFIFTAAGPGRAPHSAIDGGVLAPGEYYENIDPEDLTDVIAGLFDRFVVDVYGEDVRAVGWHE